MMPACVAYDYRMDRRVRSLVLAMVVLALCLGLATARGEQQPPPAPGSDPLHRPLDQILDVNVRDGLVYYRALQSTRARSIATSRR